MGAIHRFILNNYIERYNLDNYFETGFGDLTSFSYALSCNFKKWYGVDLDGNFYSRAKEQFASNQNITLDCDYSENSLKKWLKEGIIGNSCWFLDAHTPFSDYHGLSYLESVNRYKDFALPLKTELSILWTDHDLSKDVIIIDDFCIYAGDDLNEWSRNNPISYRSLAKELNISLDPGFIYRYLEKTHNIEIDVRDQGYLIALPKT